MTEQSSENAVRAAQRKLDPHYTANPDYPYRRLCAAVVTRAVRDLNSGEHSVRKSAAEFLAGDMEPYSSFIDIDPHEHSGLRAFLREAGLRPMMAELSERDGVWGEPVEAATERSSAPSPARSILTKENLERAIRMSNSTAQMARQLGVHQSTATKYAAMHGLELPFKGAVDTMAECPPGVKREKKLPSRVRAR